MKHLNRKQALYLLHAVVDDEASEQEKIAFLTFIETHPDIKREYEEFKFLKKLLSDKLSNKQAPEHIHDNILQNLNRFDDQKFLDTNHKQSLKDSSHGPDFFDNSGFSFKLNKKLTKRYFSAVAVIFIIVIIVAQLLNRSIITHEYNEFIVEYLAAHHFISAGGHLIEPHFETRSTVEAEQYLSDHYGMNITVPNIIGAQFAGIVMIDFIEDFQTPLLEYYQNDIEETIYVFAFDVDKIHSNSLLERHKKAVENCIYDSDFFVSEIDEHHSVSWLWNNTWYTAISNHNGYDLASLVEPLNYSP